MESKKLIPLLRIHDMCRGLSEDDINEIASLGEFVSLQSDSTVHRSGEPLESIYLVLMGRLRVLTQSLDGVKKTLRYVSAGDQFGTLILLTEEKSPVGVEVDETAIVFRISKESAMVLADQFPVFRRNMFRKVGFAVRDSISKHRKRSPSRVVAFVGVDQATQPVVTAIIQDLEKIGESIGLITDSQDHHYGDSISHASLVDESGKFVDAQQVRDVVSSWQHKQRIMFVVNKLDQDGNFLRQMALSDSVYFFSTIAKSDETTNVIKDVLEVSPSWKKKFHLVWVLEDQETVVPYIPSLPKLVERDFKARGNSKIKKLEFEQGINRLVHYLRGVSIGLALSGGAAHGMSHLGVLKALEESGITVDMIAGTSAGVLTGVIYCAGFSPDWGIEHFTRDLAPGAVYNYLPMGDGLYMLRQYRTHKWDPMLRKYLFDWKLEQLPVPIHTVTTDLISARSVVRSTGDAVNALLESINLPVISPPICRDGMLLVDGGILNNLPADELIKMGCNMIIGADVSANIEHRVGINTADSATNQMRSPNAINTLLRCLTVQAHNMSNKGAEPADIIIAPDVSSFDSTAFTQTPQMAEIGYQATLKEIPRIREVLHHLDNKLFAH